MVPRPNASRFVDLREVLPASIAYIARGPDRVIAHPQSATNIEWDNEDWAILRVDSATPLEPLPLLAVDPDQLLVPGEHVTLVSYYDNSDELRSHRLEFNWQGLPASLMVGGNSGAPILRNGQLVALFAGATMRSSLPCARPRRLRLVNIRAIIAAASVQGFATALPPAAGADDQR